MNVGTITATTAYNIIRQTHSQLGLEMPPALTKAAADNDDTVRRLTGYRFDRNALIEAAFTATAEDRDPADDPEVRRQVVRHVLNNLDLTRALAARTNDHRAAALHKHAPALIKQWATVVTDAGDTLAKVRTELPGTIDLRDSQSVTTLRPQQMTLWGEGRNAIDRIEKVLQGWTTLVNATGLAYIQHPQHRPLILADLSAHQLDTLDARTEPWRVYLTGVTLDLASPETFTERVNRVNRERQEAQDNEPTRRATVV